MRKSIKRAILFTLEIGGFLVSDLIAIALSPYGSSQSNISNKSEDVIDLMFGNLPSKTEKFEEKNIKNVIYKLKKDGLIEYKNNQKGLKIILTTEGKNILEKAKKSALPDFKKYKKEAPNSDKSSKIIIFDIPEKERRKRAWLRSAITNLGFKQLQQSVWAGNKAIPKSFLKDLKDLRILKFVEIFSIDKLGTIKPIKFES
ncbi:MAG: CRISPR-associated endonuclease Cas2 [Candidatus Colwellbacteria bacterium]|jgi:DNA-binding transcriptional regulator PaaX|nr:CRISPR-associated endonuclease Cas2 [Candidatus Colwellbacteria bacterium]MCK9497758.1 CRISPR-associated endonuclease Cas2 [Candidatus Colwellbacteria bacterium]MDD3752856.1 CRISPR-associated endonuclease Cas2 [Candidatus Colwellbacteria bacterium]